MQKYILHVRKVTPLSAPISDILCSGKNHYYGEVSKPNTAQSGSPEGPLFYRMNKLRQTLPSMNHFYEVLFVVRVFFFYLDLSFELVTCGLLMLLVFLTSLHI